MKLFDYGATDNRAASYLLRWFNSTAQSWWRERPSGV